MKNKIWCKHIRYWSRPACEIDGMDIPACGGWSFKTNEASCGLTATKWKCCPVCETKNPSFKSDKNACNYDLRLVKKKDGILEWED